MSDLPACDVYGCDTPAPVQYTDSDEKRCWDCLDADRELGEVPE